MYAFLFVTFSLYLYSVCWSLHFCLAVSLLSACSVLSVNIMNLVCIVLLSLHFIKLSSRYGNNGDISIVCMFWTMSHLTGGNIKALKWSALLDLKGIFCLLIVCCVYSCIVDKFTACIHRVQEKVVYLIFDYNFWKCRPIFKFFQ